MPEAQKKALENPYHKDKFLYNGQTDSYVCPEGKSLRYIGEKKRTGREPVKIYQASGSVCRACSAFGLCTVEGRQGRRLEIGPNEESLRAHRVWMETDKAKALYQLRKQLVEPVFGIMKEQMGARRFLLRGLANVRAEWTLLATAFNLRTLWRLGVKWPTRREMEGMVVRTAA